MKAILRPSLIFASLLVIVAAASAQNAPESSVKTASPANATSTPLAPSPMPPTSTLGTFDPKYYRVDQGDQLTITVDGPRPDLVVATVEGDGSIVLPPVGRIHLGGLSLTAAEHKLRQAYQQYRRNFRLTLALTGVRRFQVQVIGFVRSPGLYDADGLTQAYQAVQFAGGVTESGSLRRIELYEDASMQHLLGTGDMLKWQRGGVIAPDSPLWLRRRETIRVAPVGPRAEISGQVNQPGKYEFLPGETVADLIGFAGGLTPTADESRLQVARLSSQDGKRIAIKITDGGLAVPLAKADEVIVPDVVLLQPTVRVSGELVGKGFFDEAPVVLNNVTTEPPKEGVYRIREGETLRQMVLALGGPTFKADLQHVKIESTDSFGIVTAQTVDLRAVLMGEAADPVLQAGQEIIVPRRPDSVYVVGQVVHSGPVPYQANLRLRDYIGLAGGTTQTASTKHGVVIQLVDPRTPPKLTEIDLLKVQKGLVDGPELRPGDMVFVPLYQPVLQEIYQVLSSVYFLGAYFR